MKQTFSYSKILYEKTGKEMKILDSKERWQITPEEKDRYIDILTDELPMLRAKADISQEALAKIIGISRQNYGWIERKDRKMSWNTYLSLIFFFDYNQSTHKMIRAISAFPSELVDRINESEDFTSFERLVGISIENIKDILDEQAIHAIRTLIMVEYARCSNLPGEAVIKSFDGRSFSKGITKDDEAVKRALKNVKGSGNGKL